MNIIGYDPIWRSFEQGRFKARHFRLIKEGGFDTVRINLHPFRHMNPTRTVIVGPPSWNSVKHLDGLNLPQQDRNLIVTVHYYTPMDFTHQGASWAGRQDKTGVMCPARTTTRSKAASGGISTSSADADRWLPLSRRRDGLGQILMVLRSSTVKTMWQSSAPPS